MFDKQLGEQNYNNLSNNKYHYQQQQPHQSEEYRRQQQYLKQVGISKSFDDAAGDGRAISSDCLPRLKRQASGRDSSATIVSKNNNINNNNNKAMSNANDTTTTGKSLNLNLNLNCLNLNNVGNGDKNNDEENKKQQKQMRSSNSNKFCLNSNKFITPTTNNSKCNSRSSSMLQIEVSVINNSTDLQSVATNLAAYETIEAPFPFFGIFLCFASSLVFMFGTALVKLTDGADEINDKVKIVFFRGLFMLICCSIGCYVNNDSPFKVPKDEIFICALRTILGSIGVFLLYTSILFIPIGDATALASLAPIWTSVLCRIVLKEPLHLFNLIAIPISLLGVLMISHPHLFSVSLKHSSNKQSEHLMASNTSFHADQANVINFQASSNNNQHYNQESASFLLNNNDYYEEKLRNLSTQAALSIPEASSLQDPESDRWIGVSMAVATSFVIASVYTILKYKKKTSVTVTTFWLSIGNMVLSLIVMLIHEIPQFPDTLKEWSILITVGLASYGGQLMLQTAFKYEKASVISIVKTSDVAIAFFLGLVMLNEEIYLTSVLGSIIICHVVVGLVLKTYISQWLKCLIFRRRRRSENKLSRDNALNFDKAYNSNSISAAIDHKQTYQDFGNLNSTYQHDDHHNSFSSKPTIIHGDDNDSFKQQNQTGTFSIMKNYNTLNPQIVVVKRDEL